MSTTSFEWAAFMIFLLLVAGMVAGEIYWLVRSGWTNTGKSAAYVLLTDLLTLVVGSVFVSIIFFIMFMLVMGPAGRGGTAPEYVYWILTAVCIIVPFFLLLFSKRLFLRVFSIKSGTSAWIFSLVSSILTILVVVVPLPLFYFVTGYLLKWK